MYFTRYKKIKKSVTILYSFMRFSRKLKQFKLEILYLNIALLSFRIENEPQILREKRNAG